MLKQHGFFMSRKGASAHETWSNGKIAVTVSTNCYSRHTANAIMGAAGIDKKF